MPPSPRLSKRRTYTWYLSVTTMISVQKISDRTPKTLACESGIACGPWKHSRSAYSGLVPMSP